MSKKVSADRDSVFFWNNASEFLNNELPGIRKKSPHTVAAYRRSLNEYIDYLEREKSIKRKDICYQDFNKNSLKDFLVFMKDSRKLSEKTCNLRMTAIRALLAYAAEESIDITAVYVNAKTVKGLPVIQKEIEYFEKGQLTLHLDAEVPYMTILGKGSKYRNVPLMSKTVRHLKSYIREFHHVIKMEMPLFYATTHGIRHSLSDDTIQNVLKKYTDQSRSIIMMPEKVHFHMLRKTRAMDLYQAGCPLSYIQQLLGHESISTTSGFYAFATLRTLADSIEKANPSGPEGKNWKKDSVLGKLYRL